MKKLVKNCPECGAVLFGRLQVILKEKPFENKKNCGHSPTGFWGYENLRFYCKSCDFFTERLWENMK